MHLAKQEIERNPMYYKSKMYQAKRDITRDAMVFFQVFVSHIYLCYNSKDYGYWSIRFDRI